MKLQINLWFFLSNKKLLNFMLNVLEAGYLSKDISIYFVNMVIAGITKYLIKMDRICECI